METTKQDDNVALSRLGDIFKEYMLSDIQSMAAFNFVKQVFVKKDDNTCRVREWILNKINNKEIPKDCSKFQIGCPDICPNITIKAFHDYKNFDFIIQFLENIEVIKEELINIRNISNLSGFQQYKSPKSCSSIDSKDGIGSLAHDKGDWNVYYLFLHELKFEKNCESCPKTVELIQKLVPRQYYHAFFSAVTPGTHIIPHNGPTNRKLRVHIPLINIDGSKIRVGEETKYFKEGEAIVFDDSFNHESWHEGEKTRVNLIFDFWHPDLSDSEVKFFKMLQQARLKNGKKYIEMLGKDVESENYFDVIEKSKSILKDTDWWIG